MKTINFTTRVPASVRSRRFWKQHAIPKHVQPVVDQIEPIIYDTLSKVYKPLVDKLTSIDEKLGKIEKYIDTFEPNTEVEVEVNSTNEEVGMVDTKDFK